MDQKKQGQQSEGFKGQQPPHQGSQHQGSQQQPGSNEPGQQKWPEPQTPTPSREPAEPRHMPGDKEKGRGEGGGVTNRDLDREMDEQDELPDRGTSSDEPTR